MFIPTAQETRILEFFKQEPTPHSATEISNALADERERPTLSAIEGCAAKGFLKKDAAGNYVLTDAGKRAL